MNLSAKLSPIVDSSHSELDQRFLGYIVEHHPLIAPTVRSAYRMVASEGPLSGTAGHIAATLVSAVEELMPRDFTPMMETTPFVPAFSRYAAEIDKLETDIRGFFRREEIAASITDDERLWMLNGIFLTRACDNRMKQMFLSSELKYRDLGFQGKGFRSLGQEAIFGAALRLKRGPTFLTEEGWTGDVIAPLIRDLGAMLAFSDDVTIALAAQSGKNGAPMHGKDLHYGDLQSGVLFAAAPLSIATCTVTGMALRFQLDRQERVGISFIGDGGSSLGEWHEAITFAASKQLPMIYCIENNQTALSTPVEQQSPVRVFAEKARGYGIPGLTVDGTDPEAIAVAFAWAAERARNGDGPTLIEVVAMRMCGHAHHDDMLYLGEDPPLGFDLVPTPTTGYVNRDRYDSWRVRDPAYTYAQKLLKMKIINELSLDELKHDATETCDKAMQEIIERRWPEPENAGRGVFEDDETRVHDLGGVPSFGGGPVVHEVEDAPAFDRKEGKTFLTGVAAGVGDVLKSDPGSYLLGEDLAAPYGNAFLLLKPLLEKFSDRILNAPIAEGAIIGALVGAAIEGRRGIGEMQFNDFVASGFNQLVNNAAPFRYRTGKSVPFVLRMPWGGLRRAGPYHSQDTSPWFYRSFGLKIVCPSTPHDARALLQSAHEDENPVLFYEHIALYRKPEIKQLLPESFEKIPLGKAAFRKLGDDLTIISYGAYVHVAMEVAASLSKEDGVDCEVIDLRTLVPLDKDAIAASVKKTGRVLLMGEDSKTGSILESISSQISESLFPYLDGPCRVIGALDTPVPYSPSLEDEYLLNKERALQVARSMLAW